MAKQAIKKLFRKPDVDVVGDLRSGAVTDFDERTDLLLHGVPGAEIIESDLDNVEHKAQYHCD